MRARNAQPSWVYGFSALNMRLAARGFLGSRPRPSALRFALIARQQLRHAELVVLLGLLGRHVGGLQLAPVRADARTAAAFASTSAVGATGEPGGPAQAGRSSSVRVRSSRSSARRRALLTFSARDSCGFLARLDRAPEPPDWRSAARSGTWLRTFSAARRLALWDLLLERPSRQTQHCLAIAHLLQRALGRVIRPPDPLHGSSWRSGTSCISCLASSVGGGAGIDEWALARLNIRLRSRIRLRRFEMRASWNVASRTGSAAPSAPRSAAARFSRRRRSRTVALALSRCCPVFRGRRPPPADRCFPAGAGALAARACAS